MPLVSSGVEEVLGVDKAIAIATGLKHSCAVINNGKIKCWGSNSQGQLGDASNEPKLAVFVKGINNALTVSAGDEHSCASLRNGRVWCWGSNVSGQLGNASYLPSNEPVEINPSSINNSVSVVSGGSHSCALLESKNIKCWGYGGYGQLGSGAPGNSNVPVDVVDQDGTLVDDATGITAGLSYSCALRANSLVSCWGRNNEGQLGVPGSAIRMSAIATEFVSDVITVSAGAAHTCVTLNSGRVKCWGRNDSSQSGGEAGPALGGDGGNDSPRALTVIGIKHATSVATGREHSCARLISEQVECWGANQYGQLGDGTNERANVPTIIDNLFDVSDVTTGEFHSCALQNTGRIRCWGANIFGQLGDGTHIGSDVPKLVSEIESATTVSAGSTHSCAVLINGTIRCWGSNRLGALGNGSSDEGVSTTPVGVRDIASAKKVAVGLAHSCALLDDGQVHCWGSNALGKLGIGSDAAKSNYPRPVIGISDAVDVAVGILHSCAVLASGKIKCWGAGEYGELGNGGAGAGFYENSPVVVSGISDATAVSLGLFSSCARLASGRAACWGINNFGQLGLGNTQSSSIPISVLTVDNNLNSISVGFYTTCSTHSNGTIRCWGRNDTGQLGIGLGVPDEVTRPVLVH